MTDTEMNKIFASEFKNNIETISNFCLKDEDFNELCQDYKIVLQTLEKLQSQNIFDKKKIKEFQEIQMDLKRKILKAISIKQ